MPVFCLLLIMTFLALPAAALEIRSVAPAPAAAGAVVTVTGGPFTPATEVLVGEQVVTPETAAADQLTFIVPQLPAGDYQLVLRQDGQLSANPFILRIIPPVPWIGALDPAFLDECTTESQREVIIEGGGFQAGTRVLLNGAAVPHRFLNETTLAISIPQLPGGVHEVQILNPGDLRSLPQALVIDSLPEFFDIRQGADRVTTYELIIEGRNFLFDSVLVVDGRPLRPGPPPTQWVEQVEYVDCNTLIYHRAPVTTQLRQVSLQVVNPGGRQSPVIWVTIP